MQHTSPELSSLISNHWNAGKSGNKQTKTTTVTKTKQNKKQKTNKKPNKHEEAI